ncbi:hypothetical protein GA0070624_6281 [Micromonospora rhizosphaerae]|uniref:Uncharacterized protein n=1 Tax=Micromonospora rhizosphaerae TaxID=568872 RepID=A0A1C6TA47_9ACTN|nr:hypothetical protein GA0070624_6281 [Micromonospora rhizosphaerae]
MASMDSPRTSTRGSLQSLRTVLAGRRLSLFAVPTAVPVFLFVLYVASFTSGCTPVPTEPGPIGSGAPPPPGVTGSPLPPGPSTDFHLLDQATAEFLTRDAHWQVPSALRADRTARIGLVIGSGSALTAKINSLLPSTGSISAGRVQVGPKVRVTLRADPADASVIPSEAVDASTGSDVQMLWTWLVHPLHPTKALLLTAHLELPLNNGHVIKQELPLTVRVARTLPYTVRQIFSSWATWSAVGGTVVSVAGWLHSRRRKGAKTGQHTTGKRAATGDEERP